MNINLVRFRSAAFVVLAILGAIPGLAKVADPVPDVELLEVGYPDLDQFQEGIRKQIDDTRAILDRLIEDPESSPVALHEAFGNVGQLYLLYDFPDLAEACFTNSSRLKPDDYRWHYYLAVVYQFDGRFGEAAEQLERSLELFPDDVPALIRLGNSKFEMGEIDEAADFYLLALELDPRSAAALDGLGKVAAKRGEPDLAIEHFAAALELQPTADSIHHRLGMAYRAQGNMDLARSHLALNKGNQVRFGDPLVDGLSALVRSTQMHFNAGVDAMRAGQYEEAVRQFELAFEEKPDDYLVPYNLASALLRVGDREGAKRWLRKSIELEPEFRNGHFNLATMLAQEGKLEEATLHFQRAHEIDPEDQVAHLEWSTALSMSGQSERAIEELERLLELNPNNSQALLNLGIIRGSLGQSAEAAQTFERALEVSADPHVQAQAHYRLGILKDENGAPDEAIHHLQSSVELVPDFIEGRLRLAGILARLGQLVEAADHFDLVIRTEPVSMQAHFGRAMARILAERYSAARLDLEASLVVFPQEISLLHALARLLATCPDDAVRDAERALSLAQSVFERSPAIAHAETVAMALAEAGRFTEAVNLQQQVVDDLTTRGPSETLTQARERLGRYQQNQVVRAPWRVE